MRKLASIATLLTTLVVCCSAAQAQAPPINVHLVYTGSTTASPGGQLTLRADLVAIAATAPITGQLHFAVSGPGNPSIRCDMPAQLYTDLCPVGLYGFVPGTLTVRVSYDGDSNYGSDSTTASVDVRDATTLTQPAAPATARPGQLVPVSATLRDTTENRPLVGAHVVFDATVDGGQRRSVVLTTDENGTAAAPLPMPDTPGTAHITATYDGDSFRFPASARSTAFTVGVPDTTPPVFAGVPADVSVPATSTAGAPVDYATPTATDAVDGPVAVTCAPASGSTFPIGTTTVACSATDKAHNTAHASFVVTVRRLVTEMKAIGVLSSGVAPTATLTALGEPVAGRTVTFTQAGTTLCSATTDAAGKASCHPDFSGLLSLLLTPSYSAAFAGDTTYAPSQAQAGLF